MFGIGKLNGTLEALVEFLKGTGINEKFTTKIAKDLHETTESLTTISAHTPAVSDSLKGLSEAAAVIKAETSGIANALKDLSSVAKSTAEQMPFAKTTMTHIAEQAQPTREALQEIAKTGTALRENLPSLKNSFEGINAAGEGIVKLTRDMPAGALTSSLDKFNMVATTFQNLSNYAIYGFAGFAIAKLSLDYLSYRSRIRMEGLTREIIENQWHQIKVQYDQLKISAGHTLILYTELKKSKRRGRLSEKDIKDMERIENSAEEARTVLDSIPPFFPYQQLIQRVYNFMDAVYEKIMGPEDFSDGVTDTIDWSKIVDYILAPKGKDKPIFCGTLNYSDICAGFPRAQALKDNLIKDLEGFKNELWSEIDYCYDSSRDNLFKKFTGYITKEILNNDTYTLPANAPKFVNSFLDVYKKFKTEFIEFCRKNRLEQRNSINLNAIMLIIFNRACVEIFVKTHEAYTNDWSCLYTFPTARSTIWTSATEKFFQGLETPRAFSIPEEIETNPIQLNRNPIVLEHRLESSEAQLNALQSMEAEPSIAATVKLRKRNASVAALPEVRETEKNSKKARI